MSAAFDSNEKCSSYSSNIAEFIAGQRSAIVSNVCLTL